MKRYDHFSITAPIIAMLAMLMWAGVITGYIAGVSLGVVLPIAVALFAVSSCAVAVVVDTRATSRAY